MLLQRQFTDGIVSHVLVKHTGLQAEQNFSQRLVEQGMADGWISIDGNTLTMKTDAEPLRYRLKRRPGYYCTSNGERIPISPTALVRMRLTGIGDLSRREALAWLQANGKPPADYEVTNSYECVLCDEQHEKFRAVPHVSGNLVAAYTLEA